MRGKVYLVGAGPGDIGLITLKTIECLQKAEVIIYDYLVNAKILDFASKCALKICADKLGRQYQDGFLIRQERINQLLLKEASAGKVVCRLKNGDPFIFGRGGTEAEVLAKNRIPFEVIPGVTAAQGASYAGIPLTDRRYASQVILITGHQDPSKKISAIDWKGISRKGTLVVYMGVGNLKMISNKLISCGRSPETPAALIEKASLPAQRVVVGSLKDIAQKAIRFKVKPPAIFIVGEVVRLRKLFNWFERRPLFGRRILVTRNQAQIGYLSKLLTDQGADSIELPLIRISRIRDYRRLDKSISQINKYSWLIFTSHNGVRFFLDRIYSGGRDLRILKGIKIAAIGGATCAYLKQRGLIADIVPKEFSSEGLLKEFNRINIRGENVLLARTNVAGKVLPRGLKKMKAKVEEISVYRTLKPGPGEIRRIKNMLRQKEIDLLTFTSSMAVKNFIRLIKKENLKRFLKGVKIASIGPLTTNTLKSFNIKTDIMPKRYTIADLVKEIVSYYRAVKK